MRSFVKIASVLFLTIVAVGCSKSDPSVNATRLRVKLTDAPALMLRELNVEILRIEVLAFNSVQESEEWSPLVFESDTFNVLPLSNGRTRQITDEYFPIGVLRKIKIVFGQNSIMMTAPDSVSASNPISLTLAPGLEEGVIMDVNADLRANYITSILVDINAMMSVRETDDGKYILDPVMRAFPETFGGAMKGNVVPAEAAPSLFITKDDLTLLALPEGADGMFQFLGLAAGEWEVNVLAHPASGYRDTVFTQEVEAGKVNVLPSRIVLKKEEPETPPEEEEENGPEEPEA